MSQIIENRVRIYFHAVVYISICFILCLPTNTWALSDKRLCADEKCETIISIGTGAINYRAPDADLVSFQINSPIRVLSKSAGSDLRFWGVEVKGRRGYVDKKFVKETKIFIREKDLFEVDVKPKLNLVVASTPAEEQIILKASETVEIKTETTTTSPLEVNVKEDQKIINTEFTETNVKVPVQTTPVRQKIELVDGTEIPIEDLTPNVKSAGTFHEPETNEKAKQVNQIQDDNVDDNNENEDFDYEADDEQSDNDTDDIDKLFEEHENVPPNVASEENISNKVNDVDNNITENKNSTGEPLNIESSLKQTKDTSVNDELDIVEENQTEKLIINPNDSATKNGLELLNERTVINEEAATTHTVEHVTMPSTTISAEYVVPTQTTQPTLKQEEVVTPVEATVVPSQAKQNITDNVDIKNEIEKNVDSTVLSTEPVVNQIIPDEKITDKEASVMKEEKKNATETEVDKSDSLPLVPALNLAIETVDIPASPTTNQLPLLIETKDVPKIQPNVNIQIPVKDQQAETQVLSEEIKEQPNQEIEIPLPVDPQTTTALPAINVLASVIQSNENIQTPDKDQQAETEVLREKVNEQPIQEIPLPVDPQTTTAIPEINVPASVIQPNENIQTSDKGKQAETQVLKEEVNKQPIQEIPLPVDPQTIAAIPALNVPASVIQPMENIQTSDKDQQAETKVLKEEINEQPLQEIEIPLPVDPQTSTAIPEINVPASVIQPNENIQSSDKGQQAETQVLKEKVNEQPIQEIPLPVDPQTNDVTTAMPAINIPASLSSLPPLFRQTSLSSNSAETAEPIIPIANDHYKNMEQGNDIQSTTPSVESVESLLPHKTDQNEYTTTLSYQQLNSLENDEATLSPPAFNDIDAGNELGSDKDADTADAIVGVGSVETVESFKPPAADPLALPSTSTPLSSSLDNAKPINKGDSLFGTILGTVNSFLSNNGEKDPHNLRDEFAGEQDLNSILYPDRITRSKFNEESCVGRETSSNNFPFIALDSFVEILAVKLLENSQLLLCLVIAAAASILFLFGYYCFCNSSNEGALLAKLNMLERTLLATHKENSIMKHDLLATRNKLSSIEDNSFGSNDMVISLKKQLEEELIEKDKLHEQVKNLEKDLVSAADAGLELNKYVSELLANQNGDESIKDTIEELQRQLNEQDHTIKEINASLAEKSRENSELQFSLAEQNARLSSDLKILQQDNDELEVEKTNLQTHIEQVTTEFEKNLNLALESKNVEMQRLQNHILEINSKWEREHSDLQTSLAKIEALEDCLKSLKKDTNTNVDELINTAKLRGELIALQKKYSTLKTQLNSELESKSLTENQLKAISDEIGKLKKEYNQSEKDKLDAQTRLDVLSTYFKEKEAQLQKELNVKEAMWLKEQGENTGTVDKITGMQEEIQTLKSQNEELRAEIEAQVASHKAQTGILQNRVHEHYLAARQAERRYDEARNESAILRSRLTALATTGNSGEQGANSGVPDNTNKSDNKDAPSPIPGSPFFPPPLPFLPPQAFLGPSHGYMGLPPPPPFLPPPEDLRPAPLGRMRSPTTRSGRYSPSEPPRRPGRYSPNDDYSDYDDDYYDDDYDDRLAHRRRRSWQRESYSPPPRTYRSLSPAESRFNCADTETDYSPPASPRSDRVPARPINEV